MKTNKTRALIYIFDILIIIIIFAIGYSSKTGINITQLFSKEEDTKGSQAIAENLEYRDKMRDWVITISEISKSANPKFLIIPQNCTELLTLDGNTDAKIHMDFLNAIDGVGQEGLSYGYSKFNTETNTSTKELLTAKLKLAAGNNKKIIALDYCKQDEKINSAREFNNNNSFIGFQSQDLELSEILQTNPYHSNDWDINNLSEAQNCLFLLNPKNYATSDDLVAALYQTDYDIIVIDSFFEGDEMLSKPQIDKLKTKSNGSRRLVISYLSIGEAEDYRYYFDSSYHNSPPDWLLNENPSWQGNYIVEYWDDEWQDIVATGDDSYLIRIIDVGFDGVYLDIVDGYQNFE